MIILDGRKVRDELAKELRANIEAFLGKPKLAIVQIGGNKESAAYIKQKKLFAESIGALVEHVQLPVTVSEKEVISEMDTLNRNASVHGIILQLHIPDGLDKDAIIEAIAPEKDVDGLGAGSSFTPATARGILELLTFYRIPISGRKVAVLGRSKLVGAPTARLLEKKGALVTICHSKTPDTKEVTRGSDIIIVAIGKPKFVTAEYVRDDRTQTLVDVGINAVTPIGEKKLDEEIPLPAPKAPARARHAGGRQAGKAKLVGDVDFDAVKDNVAAISPVPGGVGPMTVAALFQNVVSAYEKQQR